MKLPHRFILAVLLLALAAAPAAAARYHFITLDVPGCPHTKLTGINDNGQMVGYCSNDAISWYG